MLPRAHGQQDLEPGSAGGPVVRALAEGAVGARVHVAGAVPSDVLSHDWIRAGA